MADRNTPQVRWRRLDSVLQSIAPEFAVRRYANRITAANLRRAYDAAAKGRGTSGWRTASSSADAEIEVAGQPLRDRMRDLVRNNPMAAAAVQVLVNNMVGSGIRPRAATGDPELDQQVDALWARWQKQCDAHGHTNFHGLTTLAAREMVEGGDLFALRRWQRRRASDVLPLRIELREADYLDDARFDHRMNGSRISNGIEYNADGRRSAYWMFPEHPGDRGLTFGRSLGSQRILASQVAHLFERQRTQSRGVPWGTPAIRPLRDVDDWQHAELVRKKTEACLVGVVTNDAGEETLTPVIKDAQGNPIEQFSPGMIAYADGATGVEFNQPSAVGGVYEWHRVQLHIIASGFRVPYALMTGDMSQANFSSSRVGLNEFRRMIEQFQWQTLIPMFCQPVWDWFVEAAQLMGELPVGRPIPVDWAPPRFESVNPLQDAQADLIETRAGFATLPQQIAKRGHDPDLQIAEVIRFNAKLDEGDLIFDSDPRRVSKVGQAQANDPLETGTNPPERRDP
ncbi:phage portal protein [Aestuariibius insulae]|uniref:phage portal protein n=1 Tax=Aestuariibius insulae TaxID=2058287 RepID=UPI00345E0A74